MEKQHVKGEMSRRKLYICDGIDLNGKGIEIAPFFSPIVSKSEGYNVEIIDVFNREQLIENYKGFFPESQEIPEQIIEEVDYVWNGESYEKLIGKTEDYDYVISSHMIEHVPDLLAHLKSVCNILKLGGIYSIAIPDKRYTFDFYRNTTDIKDSMRNSLKNAYLHSKESWLDCTLNQVYLKDGEKVANWGKHAYVRTFEPWISKEQMEAGYKKWNDREDYQDVHESVFTPASFELLINDFKYFEELNFEIVSIEEAHWGGEFFVKLKKVEQSQGSSLQERLDLCENVAKDSIKPYLYASINSFVSEHIFRASEMKLKNCLEDKSYVSIECCQANAACMGTDNVYHMSDESIFTISGWAIDIGDLQTFQAVYIKILGTYYKADFVKRLEISEQLRQRGILRPQMRMEHMGFEINVPAAFLEAQRIGNIEFVLIKEDGDYYVVDTGFRVCKD